MASKLGQRIDERAALKVEALGILDSDSPRTDAQASRLGEIETKVAALDADIALLAKLNADDTKSVPSVVVVGHDNALDKPWGPAVASDAAAYQKTEARHLALGTFCMAVRDAYTGKGTDPRLFAAATGAGTQSDSNLGFAVPMEVAPGIEREMYSAGELLSRVDTRTISGNSIAYNLIDETSRANGSRGGGVVGYWVDEGTAPTASNTKLSRFEMKLRKVGAYGVMTDELLSDASALGGELEAAFASELIFQVEDRIVNGNGSSGPMGILNAACLVSVAKEGGQTAATINTTNISKMWARLSSRSKANSVWLVNTECNPTLDEMSQAIGTGGTAPRFVNYDAAGTLTIKGRPVVEIEYAAAVGTVGDLILCDLSKYRLIRKGGVEQASSMHVYFSTGEQAFRAFYRVDGQPVPRAPITPYKGSATTSPFVVLATRA